MGLFNKLKNALFEEEEIEIEPTPEKTVAQEKKPEKKREEPKPIEPIEEDKDLFKVENTFKFPDFDEEEFVTSYEPTIKEPIKTPELEVKEPISRTSEKMYENISPVGYNAREKAKNNRKELKREKKEAVKEPTEKPKKGFRPSPVISPVYGVLDKNYKKEDIIAAEKREREEAEQRKKLDVEAIRRKAFGPFGTLEEDIEKTLNDEPINQFYNENTKSIDELLSDSVDDTIEINTRSRTKRPKADIGVRNFNENIEQELNTEDENLEILDKLPKKKEEKSNNFEEDTLESDLFDLIDSMYDNREEE